MNNYNMGDFKMFETNDEIIQKLKVAIHDYYMGHIKHKLKSLLINDKESEISSHIMQFLDAQIDTGNFIIVKDDIVRILNSVFFDSDFASESSNTDKERIAFTFPYSADITIEDGRAALLNEKFQTPFNGIEEKSYYLYIAPEFYDKNIKGIEEQIKKLEKTFRGQNIRAFEKEYNENLNKKQCELESARVYESASAQIELKKQKFNQVSQKMINEYGKKYDEIMARDISDYEKSVLADNLFLETKSFDEKNRATISRLNLEYEKLRENFKDKVQDSKTIYSQMQNLHLFDKSRYFEDMMAAANPELRDLYRKRYLLNSYRKAHSEFVYDGKTNPVLAALTNFLTKLRHGKAPLMLRSTF